MSVPLLLFGACDRHNLGDLLFPHVAAALLPDRQIRVVGLAARDLRGWGGHRVEALGEVLAGQPPASVDLLQVGGEVLSCEAWQAVVMLQPVDVLQSLLKQLPADRASLAQWASARLGMPGRVPYLVDRRHWPALRRVGLVGIGGADLDQADPALRAEVFDKLAQVDWLAVRDVRTRALLEQAGLSVELLPDPVCMVAELFGDRIAAAAARGPLRAIQEIFPDGYLALQFSADFGDDATLDVLAAQLRACSETHRLGVVLLRAGAAPWHDELDCYRRLAARLPGVPLRLVESLDIWEICAVLARARCYVGSSLHGRIVTAAFGLPRLSLGHPLVAIRPGKLAAHVESWEPEMLPGVVGVDQLVDGVTHALRVGPVALQCWAGRLAADYRQGFGRLIGRWTEPA